MIYYFFLSHNVVLKCNYSLRQKESDGKTGRVQINRLLRNDKLEGRKLIKRT